MILRNKQAMLKSWLRPAFNFGALAVLTGLLIVVVSNIWIIRSTNTQTYSSLETIPANQVGLVLGTSRYIANGKENLFFKSRIQAAADLYCSGKIKHILVSGDNSTTAYNEPRAMFQALRELGVAAEDISLDFAGFRTLDSVVRSKKVFQQNEITIISQGFHNHRALFIANHESMNAIAFNADPDHIPSLKPYVREYLARVKGIMDLYLLQTDPKFLGDEIEIPL
ncbi:MAG: ElyC/SanA/YdcF family protein [Bacteroidota bacterium]